MKAWAAGIVPFRWLVEALSREAMRALLTAAALLLAPVAAHAHDTFLIGPPTPTPAGQPVALSLTSGMGFPALEYGPKADRVAAVAASSGTLVVRDRQELELRLRLVDVRLGLQTAAVSLKPFTFTLTQGEVAHYMDEIAAAPELRERALGGGEFRESYAKHAKAMICVGTCTLSAEALRPVGAPLEFVADPALMRFVLLHQGRPLASHAVAVQVAGGERRLLTTDADGAVDLPADARGVVLLSAVRLVPPARTGEPWTSDFATLTLVRQ